MTQENQWDGYIKKKCSDCNEKDQCSMMKIGCVVKTTMIGGKEDVET